MDVAELEQLALNSHKKPVKVDNTRSNSYGGLRDKFDMIGLDFNQRIKQIRKYYPSGILLAAELGCFVSTIVGDMNQFEGVEAFGIDLEPILDGTQDLPKSRLIVADLNDMPQIPDNTFHYLFSFNCLSYTGPSNSFPEIFRILKPGGIADLDLEFWYNRNVEELKALPFQKHLTLATHAPVFRGTIDEYFTTYRKTLNDDPRKGLMNPYMTRFELIKPHDSTTKPKK